MPREKELVSDWLAKAADDLRMGELALSATPPICWSAAFHAQQAAEKALKGLLTFHRREYEKSHNVAYLLQLCEAVEPRVSALADRAARLTRYAVQTRYPLPRNDPSGPEAQAALEVAREMLELVQQAIAGSPGASDSSPDQESGPGIGGQQLS